MATTRLSHDSRNLPSSRDVTANGVHKRARVRALLLRLTVSILVVNGILPGMLTTVPTVLAAGGPGKTTYSPNTLQGYLAQAKAASAKVPPAVNPLPPAGPKQATGKPANQVGASHGAVRTKPIEVKLDSQYLWSGSGSGSAAAATATSGKVDWFKSQEGVLELGVPEGSIELSPAAPTATAVASPAGTSTPAAAATSAAVRAATANATEAPTTAVATAGTTGSYTLELVQTEGGFRGELMQIAQFQLHVLDSQKHEVAGVTLRQPLQLRLHYQPTELQFVEMDSLRLSWPETGNQAKQQAALSVPVTVDPQTLTMTAQVSTVTSGPLVLSAAISDANEASSEHLAMNGNQGDISFGVPLDLPPAAGGLTPPLSLSYSSAGPNGRSTRLAPAPAVGDGWNLSLASISYDATTGLYYLNDPGGVSEPLLCCTTDAAGNNYYVPHHDPQIRIKASDNDNGTNNSDPAHTGKCFDMWTPDGLFYKLGCASGLRSVVNGTTLSYYEWDVESVQRLGGTSSGYLQQYTVTYWQDVSTAPNGQDYIRDAFPKEIDYNYVGGTAQARVYFDIHYPNVTINGAPHAITYPTNYNCTSTPPVPTTWRCDDPINQPQWEAAPRTLSTITLDDLVAQVRSGGNWQTVRQYNFSYHDTPFSQCFDGFTGLYLACAGDHTLVSVQETPYQNGSPEYSIQPTTFSYTCCSRNEYHDTTELVNGAAYDAQTYWRYLTGVYDQQSGASSTVAWTTGYGNTSLSQTDPTYCDSHSCTFPGPDDRQWPRQIVTSITDNATGAKTQFTYRMNTPCGSGCAEDYWIPPNGWNACNGNVQDVATWNPACLESSWKNFYDEVFTGFQQVTITQADGATSVTQYNAGGGWASNDWVAGNEDMGLPTVEDVYQGSPSGTPLSEVRHSYTVNVCPTVSGTNQLYENPYLMCYQKETQQDTYVGGGSGTSPAVPHATQKWNYTFGATGQNHYYVQLNSTSTTGNDLVKDSLASEGTTPTLTTNYSYTYHDGTLDSPTKTNYYLVDQPAQVTVNDSASPSVQWACTQLSYDGGAYAAGANNPALTDGLVTRTDAYTDASCTNAGADLTTGAGYDSYGQPIVTTDADAVAGISGHVGCTPSVSPLVVYPSGVSSYTSCISYDTGQEVYPLSATNALQQQSTATYDVVQGIETSATDANSVTTTAGGPVYEYSGTPSLSTFQDVYGQTTLPGESYTDGGSAPWTMRTFAFSFCAAMSVNANPCSEIDTVRQMDGTNLAVSRSFFDRDGRLVETRSSGPTSGQDIVQIYSYDVVHNTSFASLPCSVPALTTANGGRSVSSTPGYVAPALTNNLDGAWVNGGGNNCSSVTGTTTHADALGRTVASDDPLGTGVGPSGSGCLEQVDSSHHTACTIYQPVVASSVVGMPSSDSEPYFETLSIDGNLHQQASYSDALGRTAYSASYNGTSQTARGSGITSQAVSSFVYNPTGTLHQATDPQGNTNSFVYDDLGRLTSSSDPDQGTTTYGYDPNGNPTSVVDARGASGTTYSAYDGLNRPRWVSASSNGSNPFASYTYDSGTNCAGSYLVGRLCYETFASGPSQSVTGSYTYQYDQRGRTASTAFAIQYPGQSQTTYTLSATYDDVDRPATVTYPAIGGAQPATLTYGYDNTAGGILSSLESSQTSPTPWLVQSVSYNGQGLLSGVATGSGAPYQVSAALSYDGDLRPSDLVYSSTPNGGSAATAAEMVPTYDAASNLQTLTTTLAAVGSSVGGTETQAFCYDSQDRLIWAGTTSGGPCGQTGSEGISGAGYTASYTYDNLGRISSASVLDGSSQPLAGAAQGSYTYDATHVHGLSSVGSGSTGYAASYDAAGNMTCRAVGATTCGSGNEQLTYDPLGQLIAWQNASGSSEQYAYDGSGQRVWQQASSTSGSTTTTTDTTYVLGVEEVTSTSVTGQQPTTNTISYYGLPGGLSASRDSSGLVVQASDLLGTPVAAENLATGLVGEQLRAPYGQARYSASASSGGGMHTTFGFTGQREDTQAPGSSGLDYFNARYYDSTVGQFTSADPTRPDLGSPWGTDAYGYVGGQVESATDPSGLSDCPPDSGMCEGGSGWGASLQDFMFDPVNFGRSLNASETGGVGLGLAGVNPDSLNGAVDSALGNGTVDITNNITLDQRNEIYTITDANGNMKYDDLAGGPTTVNEDVPDTVNALTAQDDQGDTTFAEQAKLDVQAEVKAEQQTPGDSGNGNGNGGGGDGQGNGSGQTANGEASSFEDLVAQLDPTRPVAVIGRLMETRVNPVAAELRDAGFKPVDTFEAATKPVAQPDPEWEARTLVEDEAWLRGEVKKGAQIVDIGVPQQSRLGSSKFYEMELRVLEELGYPNVIKYDRGD